MATCPSVETPESRLQMIFDKHTPIYYYYLKSTYSDSWYIAIRKDLCKAKGGNVTLKVLKSPTAVPLVSSTCFIAM